jgi:hypothetical protein
VLKCSHRLEVPKSALVAAFGLEPLQAKPNDRFAQFDEVLAHQARRVGTGVNLYDPAVHGLIARLGVG